MNLFCLLLLDLCWQVTCRAFSPAVWYSEAVAPRGWFSQGAAPRRPGRMSPSPAGAAVDVGRMDSVSEVSQSSPGVPGSSHVPRAVAQHQELCHLLTPLLSRGDPAGHDAASATAGGSSTR